MLTACHNKIVYFSSIWAQSYKLRIYVISSYNNCVVCFAEWPLKLFPVSILHQFSIVLIKTRFPNGASIFDVSPA